jgi:NADH-quinone oxidoreductase subunit A
MIQPDYSQFFPFAFFFTVLHVVALVIATIPVAPDTITIALVYILVASVGLLTLLRR